MDADRKNVPAIDSSDLKELTEKLITACHILDHEGVTDSYGHVSVRVPGADFLASFFCAFGGLRRS